MTIEATRSHYAAILISAVLWGLIGVFVKNLVVAGLGSYEIVGIRAIFSAIILVVAMLCYDRTALRIRWQDCWYFVGTGMLSMVFFNYCYFTAMQVSSISVAVALLYTAPVFVMLFSAVLFKEKLTLIKIIAALLTFGGCVLVTGMLADAPEVSFYGALLGIGSGIGYALYSVFGKYALQRYGSLTITMYTFIFGSIGIIPFMDWEKSFTAITKSEVWLFGLGIAILCSVLPYFLYTYGLNEVEAGKAAVMATVEPLVAASLGIIFFNEDLGLSKATGMVLIIFAVTLLNRHSKA